MDFRVFRILRHKKNKYIKKDLISFLKNVFGIGFFKGKLIGLYLGACKIENVKCKNSHIKSLTRLRKVYIYKKWILGSNLKKKRTVRYYLHNDIKTYKSIRYFYGLPCRGQRTHTNRKNAAKKKYF